MRSGKHIVLLTPGFPKDENDTTCIPALQLYVKHFAERYPEVKVTVIALQYPHQQGTYKWHGATVHGLGGKQRSFPARFIIWYKVWWILKKLHRHDRITVVHSFWLTECALIAQRFRKKFGVRHICTVMGQDTENNNKYLKWLKLDQLTLIAPSQFSSDRLVNTQEKKAGAVIPWGVDEATITKNGQQKRIIDVLGVGSLIKIKQYDLFLDVIAKVKAQRPDIKCVLIGGGPEKQALIKKVEVLGLQNNVVIAGQMDREEVYLWMNKSKVLLHPSSFEAFGLVFHEALAAGMRVVAFPVGASPDVVVNTKEEMVEAVANLLNNYREQDNAPETIEKTVEAYAQLYGSGTNRI